MPRKLLHGLLIGLGAAAVALLLEGAGALGWLENATWDWRARTLAKPSATTDQIRLIVLDQKSLDWGTKAMQLAWPWPREVYAPILAFCQRARPKAIAFDMLYSEPSPISVEDDRQFGAAIAAASNFVGAVFLSAEQGSATRWPPEVPRPPLPAADELADGAAGLALSRAAFPIPEVGTNAALLASVYGSSERDAIIRRAALFHVFAGQCVPTLGLAPLLLGQSAGAVRVAPDALTLAGRRVPFDRRGAVVLRYRGPSLTHQAVNAAAVIQSELRLREGGQPSVDPEMFRDRYVFFGVTAPGLMDLKATPFSRVYPGVEVHATLLDNLLAGDFIREPSWGLTALATLLLALAAGVAGRSCATGTQTGLALAAFLALPMLAGAGAYAGGYWLRVGVLEAAAALGMTTAMIVNYAVEGRQKRFIKSAFRQYLSPVVIDQLVRDPGQLKLGGETRELSIYFSDLQGFTGISEQLSPQDLTRLLNDYLTAMTDIVMEQGGTVDKYEGDAIIAFWNAPLDLADHAERAVRAALRCQAKLAELRPEFRTRVGKDLLMRVGVNTGPVVVGNMGSNQRFNYTFLGDAGNLASRLEGINKQFGTYLLISEFTAARLPDSVRRREISRVRVVGRATAVRVFEPLDEAEAAAREPLHRAFAAGLQLYYAGDFAAAAEAFARTSAQDAPARAYERRCRELAANPPPSWDGVWIMTEK